MKGEHQKMTRKGSQEGAVSFYDLSAVLNSGKELPFTTLKGKKVLLVNTASNCGFTNQYAELQRLYEDCQGALEVIAFPSNNFKEQEKGSDAEIATFCEVNFGVRFPLVKKSDVVKGPGQNRVFEWLTHHELNGWNDQPPTWNFSKYLVDEHGSLTHYFDPAVSPLDPDLLSAISQSGPSLPEKK